jgi:hypothetical protein
MQVPGSAAARFKIARVKRVRINKARSTKTTQSIIAIRIITAVRSR